MMVNSIVGLIKIIWLIAFVFLILRLINRRLYCYFFYNKEYKLWENYIKDIDKFKYHERCLIGYEFIIPNTNILAYVWDDGRCSIHNGTKCVCCSFDEYHSNKMKKLLMDKIENK